MGHLLHWSALLSLAATQTLAQGTSVADSLIRLNREGRWSEAAALGTAYLHDRPDGALQDRCRVRFGVLAALTRQRLLDTARVTLEAYDRECGELPRAGEQRELADLRATLAASTPGATQEAAGPRGAPSSPVASAIPAKDRFWRRGDPKALGLDVAALERHRAICERTGADACLVVYRGRIVQEWYGPHYVLPIEAMSSTKSVTGLLVGMLIADGKIRSADQSVCEFLSTWCDGIRGRVTLRHLLTMTAGLPAMPDSSVGFSDRKDAFVMGLVPTAEPGTRWVYSNEDVQLLSPILDRAAGEPIQDYARRRLFEPLGMRDTRLYAPEGEAWTYAGMQTTPRDFARLGLLMLQRGRWSGRQIVPAEWVRASTQPSQSLNREYGFLWWLEPEAGAFAALGHLDTELHVVPNAKLVVVRMQAKPMPGVREGAYRALALPIFRQIVRAAEP
jgi:CubicO group peptidase (beta-lactamase class C family)